MYGPTEATCGATIKRLQPGLSVNIGHPNPSSRLYILDRHRRLLPPNVVGEIYIAGVQVARGYVGNLQETADRFFPDQICSRISDGERMYRTGDRGYWNPSGEIHYLGRLDRQIKLRGLRLDLNDLEVRIRRGVPELTAVAVALKDDYLVAAVQPGSLDTSGLRSKIALLLPPYALPRHVIAMNKFPMTSVGKLDYRAIAADAGSCLEISVSPIKTPTETIVAGVWQANLKLGPEVLITGDSNFIALGGHSILQLLLAGQLTALFKRQISMKMVVESPTLRSLAESIDRLSLQKAVLPDASSTMVLGYHQPSLIEEEWWQKYKINMGSAAFNVCVAHAFDPKTVDRHKLGSAWNIVIARHAILRSRFVFQAGQGLKRLYSSHYPQARQVKRLGIRKSINRSFQLDRDNLIRVLISRDRMLVCISHIICDLTTLQVLLQEVASTYNGSCLRPVYRTYMEAPCPGRAALTCDLEFWTEYLEGVPGLKARNKQFPGRRSYNGSSDVCQMKRSMFRQFQRFVDNHGITFHQIALAAVSLALQWDSDDLDVVLGSPYFNRGPNDLETVGLFLEPLPIRVRYSPQPLSPAISYFIRSVQQSSQSALTHAVPWAQLIPHLNVTPDFPNHPLFETMVTFHDDRHTALLPISGFEPLLTWAEGAKFQLMCEFSAVSHESLLLRVEYDTEVFSQADVIRLEWLIAEALECLVTDISFPNTKRRLREVAQVYKSYILSRPIPFGTRLSTL